jgi:hypothetical protein
MPEPKAYQFSKHICALCATRGTDVFRLGSKLGIDPMELLQMINGKESLFGRLHHGTLVPFWDSPESLNSLGRCRSPNRPYALV